MRLRKQTAGGDMSFGHSQADFWRDQPEAPAQLVLTRLELRTGEWFLDQTAGTPWATKILGKYTVAIRDQVLRSRILGTTGVTAIASYASQFEPNSRAFSVQATIDTRYGVAKISGTI